MLNGGQILSNNCDNFYTVNGGWTLWSKWSYCSTSCASGGLSFRTRSCSKPFAIYNGADCVGHRIENKTCNEHIPCPGKLIICYG